MSVRLVCAICGHELIRAGVTSQLRCPLHGSRGVGGALTEPEVVEPSTRAGASGGEEVNRPRTASGSVSSPSKPSLRDPDYDFGTSADG